MAITSVSEFAEDFIRALSAGVAGAWRERWWTVDLLLVHGTEALSGTERAQDEFFHLFEALRRRGARMMIVGDRAPGSIDGIDDRLRSRFEGGLVLEISTGRAEEIELLRIEQQGEDKRFVPGLQDGAAENGSTAKKLVTPVAPSGPAEPQKKGGAWFPSTENVILHWPKLGDLLIEELE
jgi:hypothetical protein